MVALDDSHTVKRALFSKDTGNPARPPPAPPPAHQNLPSCANRRKHGGLNFSNAGSERWVRGTAPLPAAAAHTGLTAGCAPQDVVHWHVLRRQEEYCRGGGVSDRHGRLPAVAERPIVQRTGASALPLRCCQLGRGPVANAAPAQIVVLTYPLVGNYGVPDASLIDAYGRFFPAPTSAALELAY